MNSVWFAGLLRAPVSRGRRSGGGAEARRRPRAQQHSWQGVSPHRCRPARHVPRQGARCQEGRVPSMGKRYPAQKGEDGFWTATTDPQVPGFHYYWLVIDGVQVNDPCSETFYGTGKETSGIDIPEKGVDFYLPKDVPHGEVRERWYHSATTAGLAARLRLHAARLRRRSQHAVPGPVPAARRRRGRTGLVEPGTRRLHPRQPDRREEGEADDRGHGAGLRAPARRRRPPAAPGRRARPRRQSCSARSRT